VEEDKFLIYTTVIINYADKPSPVIGKKAQCCPQRHLYVGEELVD
jgi:hypothetical protein